MRAGTAKDAVGRNGLLILISYQTHDMVLPDRSRHAYQVKYPPGLGGQRGGLQGIRSPFTFKDDYGLELAPGGTSGAAGMFPLPTHDYRYIISHLTP